MASLTKLLTPLFFIFFVISHKDALSVEPEEMLKDPQLEERARKISKLLRCVVCQNESIDDSSAVIASDMRKMVRRKLIEGQSDNQIISYMKQRYGDFVLLKPQFSLNNLFLWFSPFLILIIGIGIFFKNKFVDNFEISKPLSEDELVKLEKINEK
ncbi:MAG: cytochrome c-type biogenesis protein [Pseudomonadota bacterium]|nr:cytochrome c-type biogenesis protein [Pseudomonadota bacterium]